MSEQEILNKLLLAYGGRKKLEALQEVTAQFDFSFFQPDGTQMLGKGEEKFKIPDKCYFKFEFLNLVIVNATNGKEAWQTENKAPATSIDTDRFVLNSRIRTFPLFLTSPDCSWSYKGIVDLDHFDQVHWINVVYSEKEKVSFYLDPITLWLRRYQGPSKVMGRNVTTVVVFDDYSKVEEIPFPMKQTFLMNVNKFQQREYQSIGINQGILDTQFEKK